MVINFIKIKLFYSLYLLIKFFNKMKNLKLFFGMALFLGAVCFTSCGEKPDGPNLDDVLTDGFYIVGEATSSEVLVKAVKMANGLNEADGNKVTAGLWDKYVALEADKPFYIVELAGKTEIKYGINAVETVTADGADWTISGVDVIKGTYKVDGEPFTVPVSGLYQVVAYAPEKSVFIIPVHWQLNGIGQDLEDQTPESQGYKLQASEFNKTTMTFSLPRVKVEAGNKWKIKNSDGWKYIITASPDIKINCNFGLKAGTTFNYGGAENEVAPGGADIPVRMSDRGYYTVTVVWTLSEGFSHKVKFTNRTTEGMPEITPVVEVYSLIGEAVGGWGNGDDVDLVYDAASSTATKFNYKVENFELPADGQFKIRKDHGWDTNWGFWDIQRKGDVDNFVASGDGNFQVVATKTYSSIVFTFDWDLFEPSISFNE